MAKKHQAPKGKGKASTSTTAALFSEGPPRLAIFGSRTLLSTKVFDFMVSEITRLAPAEIVTAAEPAGVCELAQKAAKQLKIPLKVHYADNDKYAAGKYERRSIAVLSSCDICLFLHDGTSKGTKNEIAVAKRLKKPFIYHKIQVAIEDLNTGDVFNFPTLAPWP